LAEIQRIAKRLIHDDFADGFDRLHDILCAAERMETERDALHRQVERLRSAWDFLAWLAAESTRGRFTDANAAAAKHLMPGDLGDETEAITFPKPTGEWGTVTHVARIADLDDETREG
jgi:hypothetical protein